VELLSVRPSDGGIRNALRHKWGYMRIATDKGGNVNTWPPLKRLQAIQQRTPDRIAPQMFHAAALSELRAWI